MDDIQSHDESEHTARAARTDSATRQYEAPGFSVISLACEISAYAPDDGGEDIPLF